MFIFIQLQEIIPEFLADMYSGKWHVPFVLLSLSLVDIWEQECRLDYENIKNAF